MKKFNFLFFFIFANYYNTHIVLYQQALSHKFLYFFLDRALRQRRALVRVAQRALRHRRPWRQHPYQKCAQILKGTGARGGDGGERAKQLSPRSPRVC